MRNSELQKLLSQYPGDYDVCLDSAYPWDTQIKLVDPYFFIDNDNGQIELSVSEKDEVSFWHLIKDTPEENRMCLCKKNLISPVTVGIYTTPKKVWLEYTTLKEIPYEEFKYWAYLPAIDCI
ncbi:MAG TPA: hypothetical protein DDW20_00740 [Firmicutes bacterium]|nr:hypothetical protein [Bacillota bacterium]